jgi:hypothetical protein
METSEHVCVLHEPTFERITATECNVKDLICRTVTLEKTVATILERVDWIKAIVWLVAASLLTSIIGIIMQVLARK